MLEQAGPAKRSKLGENIQNNQTDEKVCEAAGSVEKTESEEEGFENQ